MLRHRASRARRASRAACAACAACAIFGCANSGDPPGGPPDTTPPTVVAIDPDSGVILSQPPSEASIVFDEVVDERILGTTTDFKYAVILSPDAGATRVSWRRDRLTVRPREGFKPGRVSEGLFDTDTYMGFSGGDVAPFIPGSRFRVFDN